jgi:HK97 family phage major capsid protein
VLDQQTAQSAGTSAYFGGVVSSWTAEAGAFTETEPTFRMLRLVAHKLAGYTLSSTEALADSAVALEALLRTLFAGSIAWTEDYAFLRGDGVGKPLGIQPAACTIAVNRAGANAIALADAGNMLAKLLPASYNNAVWVRTRAPSRSSSP